MSGGVGPPGDIRLPKGEEEEEEAEQIAHAQGATTNPPPPTRRRFLSLRQLNALVVIVILSASGLVSVEDFAFFVFSLAYVHFLSRFVFPPARTPGSEPPTLSERSRAMGLYVLLGVALGLVVPVVYIFEGVVEGVRAATPHVVLMASQVFMEGVTSEGGFSPPVRVFVPVLCNTRRIFAIVDWLRAEVGKVEGLHGSARRLRVGRTLAAANLLFWGFNLFGVLLPVHLPRAFKRYYAHEAKA